MGTVCVNTAMSGFRKRFEKGVDFGREGWYSNQAVRQGGGSRDLVLKKRRKKCLTNGEKSDRIATFRK